MFEAATVVFLASGLFLGWSLGANDAANIFGTAVGSGMIRFATAAIICSVFVILGAVVSGAGAAGTLGQLGAVNALPGAFMVALSAALTVYWMTKAGLPVSTGQAIVGGIVGWNLFSGFPTDLGALTKIVGTWVFTPLLAGAFSVVLFKLTVAGIRRAQLHIIRLDSLTRWGLILAGAFGAYSLGANNIANVMGVFVESNPFTTSTFGTFASFTAIQKLFLLGAIAIAVGVFTYSKRVMLTVGGGLMPLSPVAAWVVVVAQSIVLFLFASQGLESFLAKNGLPTIPLVPVSSSQAVIGAVIGIGLLKGGRGIKWGVLANVASGWVTTPVISALVCFVALFFLQNVFNQQVFRDVSYVLSPPVLERLDERGVPAANLNEIAGTQFDNVRDFRAALESAGDFDRQQTTALLAVAEISKVAIDPDRFPELSESSLSPSQISAIRALGGQTFVHRWQLEDALAAQSPDWQLRTATTANKLFNKDIEQKRLEIERLFADGN